MHRTDKVHPEVVAFDACQPPQAWRDRAVVPPRAAALSLKGLRAREIIQPEEESMLAFHNMAVNDAPANKTLRLKKAKTNISQRALCVRYAEVLALRQAILETQSAKPTRDDRLVSR